MRALQTLAAAALIGLLAAPPALAQDATPEDAKRWAELMEEHFPGRSAEPAGDALRIEAPARAADAAIVPIAIRTDPGAADPVTRVHLFVDDNPVPHALSASFGKQGPGAGLETRVRVDSYTFVHAVAETAGGKLLQTEAFVKASGGCSAPALKDAAAAAARIGKMRLNIPADAQAGQPVRAQLLVSHPNNSGFQFDQVSRTYIQPHYVQRVVVRHDGELLLDVETDISVSEDPSLHFTLMPTAGGGTVEAEVTDSKGAVFKQSWPVGGPKA